MSEEVLNLYYIKYEESIPGTTDEEEISIVAASFDEAREKLNDHITENFKLEVILSITLFAEDVKV